MEEIQEASGSILEVYKFNLSKLNFHSRNRQFHQFSWLRAQLIDMLIVRKKDKNTIIMVSKVHN